MRICVVIIGLLLAATTYGQSPVGNQFVTKTAITGSDTVAMRWICDSSMITQGWGELGQAKFWQTVMTMPPDSALLNVASSRKMLRVLSMREWNRQTDSEKDKYKAAARTEFELAEDEKLYVTMGRNHFYQFEKALPNIAKAIPVFEAEKTDPWYAQVILLIESPGAHNQSSGVGAHGPFQLMKSVALKRGLRVDKFLDEREDVEKAAVAAAKLIRLICIPETKRMLDAKNVSYKEDDLWFRLLVLHSYHAGSGNVRGVIEKINPDSGGIQLIQKVWRTEYKGFKNASQNYSQVALAASLTFIDVINSKSDTVFLVEGDQQRQDYLRRSHAEEDFAVLESFLGTYRKDLMEHRLEFDDYMSRVQWVENEMVNLGRELSIAVKDPKNNFSNDEKEVNALGHTLMKRRRYPEALACFQYNCETHPDAWNTYDSLGYAYRKLGDKKNAITNYQKSVDLNPNNSEGKAQLAKLRGQ